MSTFMCVFVTKQFSRFPKQSEVGFSAHEGDAVLTLFDNLLSLKNYMYMYKEVHVPVISELITISTVQ